MYLRPHRPVGPVVNFPQRADDAVLDPLDDPLGGVALPKARKCVAHLRLAGGLDHQPGLVHPVGQRLVHHDVLALLHRRHADGRVQMVGRHDLDRVDALLLVQQLAEVLAGGGALEVLVARLLANRPRRLPGKGRGRREFPACFLNWVREHPADAVAESRSGPVQIVRAVLHDVADGHDLERGLELGGYSVPGALAPKPRGHRQLGAPRG